MLFWMKQGDTLPSLTATIRDAAGALVDFTSATAITFKMRNQAGALLVDRAAIVGTPATAGVLRYDWRPEDTALAGIFNAEFEVVFGPEAKQTFPTDGFIRVMIGGDLDAAPGVNAATLLTLRANADETGETFFSDSDLVDILLASEGDLSMATATLWRRKAGIYAGLVDTSESGSSRKLSDLHKHALAMVGQYSVGGSTVIGGVVSVRPSSRPIVRR